MPPSDLPKRQLEVTVWHHQCDGRLEFLGEFLLDLASILTNEIRVFVVLRWVILLENDCRSRYH